MATFFIDPGALRTELSLQTVATSADGLGGFTENWTEFATVFGHVEPLTAESRYGAGQTLETVTHRITLRHRADVSSGMRFSRQDRIFEIVTVHDPDESERYLVCRAQEMGA